MRGRRVRFFFRRRAGKVQPDRVDARDVLADVRVDIVHADQKGALILATVGLVFGVVLAAGFEGRLDVGGSWTGLDSAATWGSLSWWLGVCSAAVACGFAGASVWPRYRAQRREPAQINYWGDVAWYSGLTEFRHGWARRPSAEARTLAQLWFLSRVVAQKYRCIRVSMTSAAVAGVFLVLGAVLNLFK